MLQTKNVPVFNFNNPFPYKRIRVFPDRDLKATILEMAMIDTRIMQRLRNTKQLGNSNVSYPTAEHSRFTHSLGVLYWTSKILSSLKDNHNALNNNRILEELNGIVKEYIKTNVSNVKSEIFKDDEFLGTTWFDQLVRIYALLHDISHIPFGHTIEDQAGIFKRHDDDISRLNYVFEMLQDEVSNSYHFKDNVNSEALAQISKVYISLVQSMFVLGCIVSDPDSNDDTREEWITKWNEISEIIRKPLLLGYDIVSNTICADLMDYTLRDTLFASMPKTFDKSLLTCMKIVEFPTTFYQTTKVSTKMYRLGINISRKKVRHDMITAILDLLRIRYDLTEKVYYHHTKVITDAMLEKVLRSLKEENSFNLDPKEIYKQYLGDEGFISLIESKLSSEKLSYYKHILELILKRNLYKAAFRITKNMQLSKKGREYVKKCKTPEGRNELEAEIIKDLTDIYSNEIQNGDIIISFPPEKMQRKVAKALIEWTDGQVFTFESLPLEANYSNEVGVLTERYQSLWSMTIYINPDKIRYIRLIESYCETKFDIYNETILKNYLKEKYKEIYESQETMTDINHKVISIESNRIDSKAAKKLTTEDRTEMVEDAYDTALKARKEKRKPSKAEKKVKQDDMPILDLKDSN